MKDVFTENNVYKCIHYMSVLFGTWMTIDSKIKQFKVIAYTISLIWCLAIVENQIDYAIKPMTEEYTEKRKQDTTFERIIRLDFWTYNAIYFLSCFFSMFGERIEVKNMLQTTKNLSYDTWRMLIVFILIIGNLIPTYLSYCYPDVQTKTEAKYNLLFQDVCKLGILTVDLQFTWFCWSLKDGFSTLNDKLRLIFLLEDTSPSFADKVQAEGVVANCRNNDNTNNDYRYEIHRVNIMYAQLMDGLKNVRKVCEERILMNLACYMFNTICGLFNTISAYRTEGTPIAIIVIHFTRVMNCAGRITVVCCAASSVVDQDDCLHDLAQIAKETSDTNYSHYSETKQFLRRLSYSKVKFDVCGMITIDKALLSSAVISIISYLVIVLQYNYS